MPGINDLKNDGNNERFIPHVKEESENVIVQPTAAPINKATVLSMSTGREKADLSNLPKSERETIGVEIKESIQSEIFKPGGPFDEYKKRKTEEALEFIAEQEAEAELAAAEGNISSNITDEEEIEKENYSNNEKVSSTTIDIFADTKEEIDTEDEELLDDLEEDELEEEEVEEMEKEIENIPIKEEPVEEKEIVNDINIMTTTVSTDDGSESALDEDELEVEDTDSEEDEGFEILKKMITERIKPVTKKMDLSSFTIASKPLSTGAVVHTKEVAVAKWVLPTTGVTVLMKEFLGADLEKLRILMNNNDARGTLQLIYDHILANDGKEKLPFEKWLKSTAYDDYDHLFMAIYIASFQGANFMPIDCRGKNCKYKSYVTDNIPFSEMVKYKDDEAKNKFNKLYAEEPSFGKGFVSSEIVTINDHYAVGFVIPSLYSIMIENGYFDQSFISKYSSTISIAPYIGEIYEIDTDNMKLIPVAYKEYVNNDAKTAKSKIIKYSKIISTLTSDEITTIRAYVEALNKNDDMITYQVHKTTCPQCAHENPAIEDKAATMVFLRNQLTLLVNT